MNKTAISLPFLKSIIFFINVLGSFWRKRLHHAGRTETATSPPAAQTTGSRGERLGQVIKVLAKPDQ